MKGSVLLNLGLFRGLCGQELNRVVLTTTMWDLVDEKTGVEREKELSKTGGFWKPMLDRGSSVKHFRRTQASAFEVLVPIFEQINGRKAILLQQTLADLGAKLEESMGGRKLFEEIEDLAVLRQEKLDSIRRERQNPSLSQAASQSMMEGFEKACLDLQWLMTKLQKVEPNTRKLVEATRHFFE